MITKELIENILKVARDDNRPITSDYIYSVLRDVEDIKANLRVVQREKETEQKRFEAKVKDLNCRFKEIQERCGHLSKTYHPDPSGNSDSFYSCDICDKTL